jgi:hypothetical protein
VTWSHYYYIMTFFDLLMIYFDGRSKATLILFSWFPFSYNIFCYPFSFYLVVSITKFLLKGLMYQRPGLKCKQYSMVGLWRNDWIMRALPSLLVHWQIQNLNRLLGGGGIVDGGTWLKEVDHMVHDFEEYIVLDPTCLSISLLLGHHEVRSSVLIHALCHDTLSTTA